MKFFINNFEVGSGTTYVISEIGNNHNGSLDRAMKMIEESKEFGADCVKFQMRNVDSVYRRSNIKKSEDLGAEYTTDLIRKFELSIDDHKKLFEYAKNINIDYLCTPWDSESIRVLEDFGVGGYKVASADLTNIFLLRDLINTNKPLILSTGMSTEEEIKSIAKFLNDHDVKYAMLHCNSTYPAPLEDINLRWMLRLKEIHQIVGYSGHERGISVSLAAVALGASIIERHFTLDKNMEGPDHMASLTGSEFKALINGIREIEIALGNGQLRDISQGELINRESLSKSLIASRNLTVGHVVTKDDIDVKSPGQGLSPMRIDELVGKRLSRDLLAEDFFYESDITGSKTKPDNYHFNRPWGIPVRYHDIGKFSNYIQPDFWEFHLSYQDLALNPNDYLEIDKNKFIIVHAPELFNESHLLDLASTDHGYRKKSVEEFQNVINLTLKLKEFYPKANRPMIVSNIGGFSANNFMSEKEKEACYRQFIVSLSELRYIDEVQIIPQTMAPFPWHFGGQRFQNLFMRIEEIEYWCNELDLKICLDISHSKLACNYLGLNFKEFISRALKYTAHIHYGDARGLNGEGLQIGTGEINFKELHALLDSGYEHIPFIPEIWQGHKNDGEGFWIALNKINKIVNI